MAKKTTKDEAHDLWDDWQGKSGLEGSSADEYLTPFLQVLQDLSPQTKKRDAAYVDGAEPGDLLLTSQNRILRKFEDDPMKNPLEVSVIGIARRYNEWIPRSRGGGLVQVHTEIPSDTVIDGLSMTRRGQDGQPNDIIDTRYFGLRLEETGEMVILAFSRSTLKVARRWMSMLAELRRGDRQLPVFARTYLIGVQPVSNEKGSWYEPRIERGELCMEIDKVKLLAETHSSFALDNRDVAQIAERSASAEDAETIPF